MPLRRTVLLREGLPPKHKCQFARSGSNPRRGPDRSPEYLAWIRTLGCVICSGVSGESAFIEAAHLNVLGKRGLGQKTYDFWAIPLCIAHHRENLDSYRRLGEQRFVQAQQTGPGRTR